MVSKRVCLRAVAILLFCVSVFLASSVLQTWDFGFFTSSTTTNTASLAEHAPSSDSRISGAEATLRGTTPALQQRGPSLHVRGAARDPSSNKFTKPNRRPSGSKASTGMRWLPAYDEESHPITLTSNTLCQHNTTVRLLVFVLSSVNNFRRREAIRKSWASPAYNVTTGFRLGFMLGSASNVSLQKELRREAEVYGDIVQVNYPEDYYNITLSSITTLRWATENCPSYEYLVKADDDSFLQMALLYEYLNRTKPTRSVLGIACRKNKPNRIRGSKWYTPPEMYNKTYLPDFTKGFVYVITADVVRDLYKAAQQLRVFPFEDVFITGMCRELANATVLPIPNFIHTRLPPTGCSFRNLLAGHRVSAEEMGAIWKELQKKDLKCAKKKKT